MTSQDLLTCSMSKLDICPGTPTWTTLDKTTCESAVITVGRDPLDRCSIKAYSNQSYPSFNFVMVGDNEWFVSHDYHALSGRLVCD